MIYSETLVPGYAVLMSPNKDETAVHGCHCPGDMALELCCVQGVLPVEGCKGRLRLKGEPFLSLQYTKG